MAKGLCYKPRDSYGVAKEDVPPASFHYDRWLGPAQWRPYSEKRSHYCWHWYWDTGNGDSGNQGPHQFDVARWGLNKNEHPVSVLSNGGIYGFRQDEGTPETRTPGVMVYGDVEVYGHDKTTQETPNTQSSIFKYSDGKILEFETRGRYTNPEGNLGIRIGVIFYGTEGFLELNGDGDRWAAFRRRETTPFASNDPAKESQPRDHYANFLEAIRSGKDTDLHCDINEGFYSSALPSLANISYRLGRGLTFDGKAEKFVKDEEADKLLTRDYRKSYTVPREV